MAKRLISIALSIVMVFSLPFFSSFSSECYASDMIEYSVENGSIIFNPETGYIIDAGAFIRSAVIPSTINGVTVKGIGELAFDFCRDLTSITLPNTIEEIGEDAFRLCDSLTSITIPDSVRTIGKHAFLQSGLLSVVIPNSVTSMGEGVFEKSDSLRVATVGSGITRLPDVTFGLCIQLEEVYLPSTLIEIGKEAFATTNLSNVTLPPSLQVIDEDAFANCQSLTTVSFNEGLRAIKREAFMDCYNMEINLPASLVELGDAAFEENLGASINVAAGNGCFTSVDGVLFSKDMKKLIQYPLGKTENTYTVPNGVTEIGFCAFGSLEGHSSLGAYRDLQSVILPDSIVTIGDNAFCNSDKLTQINFPAGLKSIGNFAFLYSNLEKANLPEGLTQLGEGAFSWCEKLDEITIPSTINAIPKRCFYGCSSLKEVVIPEGVISLGELCFDYTSSIEKITFPKTVVDCGGYINGFFGYGNRISNHPSQITIVGYTNSAVHEWYLNQMNNEEPDFNLKFTSIGVVEKPVTPSEQSPVKPSTDKNNGTKTDVAPSTQPDISDTTTPTVNATVQSATIQTIAKQYNVDKTTLAITDKSITNRKDDNDIKGSTFGKLRLRQKNVGKKDITIQWTKCDGADGYIIYGNKCGKNNKYIKLKTVGKNTLSFKKTKLKSGTYYKYIVRAYKVVDGKKVTIAASKTVHITTNGGKKGNSKAVQISKFKSSKSSKELSLNKGKSETIKAKELKKDKPIAKHIGLRYESSNTSIATVNSKGKITAKKSGKCVIYVYAQNGNYKTINVTVK